jgi:hypothetical protein
MLPLGVFANEDVPLKQEISSPAEPVAGQTLADAQPQGDVSLPENEESSSQGGSGQSDAGLIEPAPPEEEPQASGSPSEEKLPAAAGVSPEKQTKSLAPGGAAVAQLTASAAASAPVFTIDSDTGMFGVKVEVTPGTKAISGIEIPIWNSSVGGQDDIIWHVAAPAPGTPNTYIATTSTTDHMGQSGTYQAHVYVKYSDGSKAFLSAAQADGVNHPDRATLKASVSSDNRSVAIEAWGGATGRSGARFAVWSSDNGQDDLIWYNAARNGGKLAYSVPLQNHKSTGRFEVHLYAGTTFAGAASFNIEAPSGSAPVFDLDSKSGVFKVSVELKNTPAGVSSVEVPIWNSSSGGQDDLVWHKAVRQEGSNIYTVTTSTTEHRGQSGAYVAHVYVTDLNGARTFVSGASRSITHPSDSVVVDTPQINAKGTSVRVSAYGGSLGNVGASPQFAVWSLNGGQDDLVWYGATLSNGKWAVDVPLNRHKSTGVFAVHIYKGNAFAGSASFNVLPPKPSGSGVRFDGAYDSDKGNLIVTATVEKGSADVTSLKIPIWGNTGGQNDLIWHEATLVSTSGGVQKWKVDTSVPTHLFEEGQYIAHAYAVDANGAMTFIAGDTKEGVTFTGAPIITATLADDGRTAVISAGGGAFSKAGSVSFPTWSTSGGQDDIRWYPAQRYGNAWVYRVPLSNHRSVGEFNVHAYATLSGKSTFTGAAKFNVDGPSIGSGKVEFVSVNSDTYTGYFAVHVPVNRGTAPVSGVRIAVWSEVNGQNDIRWLDAHVVGGNVWGASDSVRDHRLETGTYIAHVYVTDANGASTFVGAAVQKGVQYTGPKSWGTYIDVNLSSQHLVYFENGIPVLECDIVSGLPGPRATPTGTFRIYSKSRNVTFQVGGFSSYWMPFLGGYGLHDATWQPSFGGDLYKSRGSHGCVNMPLSAAGFLYARAPIGTEVRVHW